MGTMRIGLQLYTLREAVSKDLKGTLQRVADMGYQGIEFAGFGQYRAEEIRTLLTELGLECIGSHVDFYQVRDNLESVMEYHRMLGAPYIVCPFLEETLRDTEEKCISIASQFEQWGNLLKKNGFHFAYHNHSFEFQQKFGNRLLYDTLIQHTSSGNVAVELDVCWIQHGGQDPISYIDKYSDRTCLIHLKDLKKAGEASVSTVPLGEGEMDLATVVAKAKQVNVDWLIVEQDECQYDPFKSVWNSLNWLKHHSVAEAAN